MHYAYAWGRGYSLWSYPVVEVEVRRCVCSGQSHQPKRRRGWGLGDGMQTAVPTLPQGWSIDHVEE